MLKPYLKSVQNLGIQLFPAWLCPCYVLAMPKRKSGERDQKPVNEWYLGSQAFYFAVIGGHVQEVSEHDFFVDQAGQIELHLHVGMVEGSLACIGVDVRSFTELEGEFGVKPLSGRGAFSAIRSPAWRSLPIGGLAERAIEQVQEAYARMARETRAGMYDRFGYNRAELAARHDQIAGSSSPSKRRGPKPSLSEETLRTVVALAYGSGGRKPVVAVQRALQEIGHLGPWDRGTVTIDQARKAVQAARKIGAIPPVGKQGATE